MRDICDSLEMPFIDPRYDPDIRMPSINLHPNPSVIGEVLVNLVNRFEWTSFMILYENGEFLPRMSELLKLSVTNGPTITARRIDLGLNPLNFRSVLRTVKLSKETRIIIECSIEKLDEILKQTQQIGLMTDQHHFILTNFDVHTIDMEPYQYSGTRITTLRLIDIVNPIPSDMETYFAKKAEEKEVEEKPAEENSDSEDDEGKERRDEKKEVEEKKDEDETGEQENEEDKGEDKQSEEEKKEEENFTEKTHEEEEEEAEGIFIKIF